MVCKYRNTTVTLIKLLLRNISLQSKLKEFCLLYMTSPTPITTSGAFPTSRKS